MPPINLGRDSLAIEILVPLITPAIIGLRPVIADGVVARWRSAPAVTPRAGVVPRAGVPARDCAMLAAASTNETTPEAKEPKSEDAGT